MIIELGDYTYEITKQPSARSVLDAMARLSWDLAAECEDNPEAIPHMNAEPLAEWCGQYLDVSGDTIDRRHSPFQVLTLRQKIVAKVSPPDWLIEDCKQIWLVSFNDGCGCPVCNPDSSIESESDLNPDQIEAMGCELSGVKDYSRYVASKTGGVLDERATLDDPWWTYELICAYNAAAGEHYSRQREKRDNKSGKRQHTQGLKNENIRSGVEGRQDRNRFK